jgi:hypothetical protein
VLARAVWLTWHMFASHEAVLAVCFSVARDRLARLTHGGWLGRTSEQAFADGLARLAPAGPRGAALGLSRLVRVSVLEPVPRTDEMLLPLRWEATGPGGPPFAVLDANLQLSRCAGERTRLVLTGSYRPPLGSLGAPLDRAALDRAATATIRSLLARIAEPLAAR